MLSDEEQLVLNYLKASPEAWVGVGEICRKASARNFREDPRWAYPALMRLFTAGLVESDPGGHYRYVDCVAIEKERQEQLRKRNEE